MEKEAQKKEEEVIIRHFSHEKHPLILKKVPEILLYNRRCGGCDEWMLVLYDDEPYCYSCEECEYHLHKMCAEAPLSIHHPLHQHHHPLRLLLDKPPYQFKECKACCKYYRRDFTYHCSTCKFDIHLLCGISADRKEFRHFSHLKHPLVVKKLPPQIIRPNKQQDRHAIDDGDSDGDGELGDGADDINQVGLLLEDHHICKGCGERISLYGEPYYYRCDRGCDYDLHKVCAEAPLSIQHHPLHPPHRLKLRFENGNFSTKCCRRRWVGFLYICSMCDFDMDIICATTEERKVYNPHHEAHLLSLHHQQHSAWCNACGIEDRAIFFQCSTCLEFWLHKDCALLPKQIKYYRHDHPLTISYGLTEDHAQHSPPCRICKITINKDLWIYSCEKCRYFVHINCIMKPQQENKVHNSSSDSEEDGRLVRKLPLADEFHSLMEHLLLYYDFAYNDLVHDHPLILLHDHHQYHGELRDDDKSIDEPQASSTSSIPLHDPMKRIKLLCNACVRPISEFPFYRCGGIEQQQQQQCCKDFVLHKRCAELPNELPRCAELPNELPRYRLFYDQHPLMLLPKVPKLFFNTFICKLCMLPSNGFAYGCVGCEYYIDVRCAFMPVRIRHEAHPEHVLHLRQKVIQTQANPTCGGCRNDYCEWMFCCDECNKFTLCSGCAQLPKTMRHKYDRHPLQLMYLPPEDHISQYFCDICEKEKEMDPNIWFYHCADCDQQIQLICCSDILFGIKYGGFLTINCHPHPLTFSEWPTESNVTCNLCKLPFPNGFRCVECKYALNRTCASLIWTGKI